MSLAEAILDYATELETNTAVPLAMIVKNLRLLVKASGAMPQVANFPGMENLTAEQKIIFGDPTVSKPSGIIEVQRRNCIPVKSVDRFFDEKMVYCRGGKSDGDATMIPADLAFKSCRVIDGEVYVFGENQCFNYDETLTQQVLKSAESCGTLPMMP